MGNSIPEGIDFACVSEDRLGDAAERTTKVSFSFTLHLQINHSSMSGFTGNPSWRTPAFSWTLLSSWQKEEREWRAIHWLVKLCLEMTHLFCSHFICQRKSVTWLCMSSAVWRCVIFHQERHPCGWKVLQSPARASPFCHSHSPLLFLRKNLQFLMGYPWG